MRNPDWEAGFYAGVLAALTVVDAHDQGVVYREIVQSCGQRAVVRAAEDDFDRKHLRRNGYRPRATLPPAGAR